LGYCLSQASKYEWQSMGLVRRHQRALSCDLLHGPSRHLREERAESLHHRRLRKNGVADPRIRRFASIAIFTAPTTSPASAPMIVRPRIRSSLPPTSAFMKPCVSSVASVRSPAVHRLLLWSVSSPLSASPSTPRLAGPAEAAFVGPKFGAFAAESTLSQIHIPERAWPGTPQMMR
jgi:hypothetical protein